MIMGFAEDLQMVGVAVIKGTPILPTPLRTLGYAF